MANGSTLRFWVQELDRTYTHVHVPTVTNHMHAEYLSSDCTTLQTSHISLRTILRSRDLEATRDPRFSPRSLGTPPETHRKRRADREAVK
jgi:hypothetical protein